MVFLLQISLGFNENIGSGEPSAAPITRGETAAAAAAATVLAVQL